MTSETWEIVRSDVRDTADAPRGKDLYYRCTLCNVDVPSQPRDNVGCKCGNIFLDIDYFRMFVRDFDSFLVVRRIKK